MDIKIHYIIIYLDKTGATAFVSHLPIQTDENAIRGRFTDPSGSCISRATDPNVYWTVLRRIPYLVSRPDEYPEPSISPHKRLLFLFTLILKELSDGLD